jgi:thiamine-phosphate pyrophosphorylase
VPVPAFDLYLVTDRTLTGGRDLLWVIEQALAGGVRAIQLREKDLDGRRLYCLAAKARRLCERYDAMLFINDRVDLALAVDAAGVQLGNMSLPVSTARSLLGPEKLIGASIHSLTEACTAERQGADFLVFGPVFYTPSKAAYGAPQGVTALRELVESSAIPVYGIGGVSLGNACEVLSAGAQGIALISAIIGAPNPKSAARALLDLLNKK